MQVTATKTITTTVGALSVTIVKAQARNYVGSNCTFNVQWTPVSGYYCTITIAYGDGATDSRSAQGPPVQFIHAYASAGTKTISATVTDGTTNATGTGSTTIDIASLLACSLSADPISGPAPLAVTFTFSMSGGFTPYIWTLNPGDGSTPYSSPASPKSHTYVEGGKTYTATLTVVDVLGVSASIGVELFTGIIAIPWLRMVGPLLVGVSGLVASKLV